MQSEKWEHVKDIFDAASRQTPGERAQLLDELCGNDHDLRREVESLLSSFDKVGGFMAQPVLGEAAKAGGIQQSPLTNGQYLGHYEICEQIGEGGMGQVYLARDTRLNRLVALKILPAASTSEQARQRLRREARAAATLDHPNICAIYEINETDGCDFIVMQYVKGETLAEKLKRQKMSLPEVLHDAIQIADALDEAHVHGVIHCDVKPANVIINDKGQVKVLDFGVARFSEDLDARNKSETARLSSKSGAIMGTVPLMSPEQVRGQTLDARTDIFSFGAMLYEMSSGRLPFVRDTDAETISAILRDEPSWENIPRELQPILRKCLTKRLDERYQTAKDLATDLRELRDRLDSIPAAILPMEVSPQPKSETTIGAANTDAGLPPIRKSKGRLSLWILAAALVSVIIAALLVSLARPGERELTYEQLTHFTDSAVSPALSPDGRMIAFLRSDNWFLTRDQIYVKLLPNGEPVQITNDPRQKYGLAFSPDGSQIAYTAVESQWKTVMVSPLGGAAKLFLSNAAGFSWLDERRFLFSEIKTGAHMGLVTASENRSDYRSIYFPQDERGMVHLSYPSPDRKWVLLAEMNPIWQPCRLISFDGSSPGRQVGPKGKCTSAAWSPDGNWMYFGVEVEGQHHLWRQRFPAGKPEPITSGPTEEDGIAVASDGRSLITSIGMHQNALWIKDPRGERPLSSEGHVPSVLTSSVFGSVPIFTRDGKSLFYLKSESAGGAAELWRTDLTSEKSEAVVRGIPIFEYDISDDANDVVFSTQPLGKPSQLWLAKLDRSSPPRMIASAGEDSPHFGPGGDIVYRLSDSKTHYLGRMNGDGTAASKASSYAIGNVVTISPDRHWIVTISVLPEGTASPDGSTVGTMAVPIGGGAPRVLCLGCGVPVRWSPDGRFFYIVESSRPSKSYAIPLAPGEIFPKLPASGFRGVSIAEVFPDVRIVDADLQMMSPSSDPSVYAYVKTTMHRNLFRIPLF